MFNAETEQELVDANEDLAALLTPMVSKARAAAVKQHNTSGGSVRRSQADMDAAQAEWVALITAAQEKRVESTT